MVNAETLKFRKSVTVDFSSTNRTSMPYILRLSAPHGRDVMEIRNGPFMVIKSATIRGVDLLE